MLQPLLFNLLILLATAYAVSIFGRSLQGRSTGSYLNDLRIAPVFALAVLLLMAFPALTPFGSALDARAAPAVLSGLFGGPISAGLTLLVGGLTRAWIGGPYATGGVVSMACYGLLGLAMRPAMMRADTDIRRIQVLLVAAVASVIVVLPSFIIDTTLEESLRNLRFSLPFLIVQNLVGITMLGIAIIRIVRIAEAGSEAALLRSALSRATNGVLIIEGKEAQIVTYANAGAEAQLGQRRDDIIGRPWHDVLSSQGIMAEIAPIRDAIARGVPIASELRISTPDGKLLSVRANLSPVVDDRADGSRAILILDDVTKEREQAQLLSVVTEHLPLLIAYFDRDLRSRYVNRTYGDFFGLKPEGIIGRHLSDILGEKPFAVIETSVRTVLTGQRSERQIEMVSPVTGTRRVMRESLFPQFADGSERVDGYVVMVEDITEQVRTEENLRRSEKLSAIGTLAGSIAHDFNNLSAVVIGNIELAQLERDAGRQAQFLNNALDASERAAALTKKLLSFARQAPLSPETMDLAAEIEGHARHLEMSLNGKASLRIACDRDAPAVNVDRNGLLNALMNLVTNARDASPQGGNIDIRLCRLDIQKGEVAESDAWSGDLDPMPPGTYTCIEVLDQGEGVLPEHRQRILDPFFTTKPFGMSAGLGLSITYGFVRQSGGFLRVSDNQPRGTRVMICFPAAVPSVAPLPDRQKPAATFAGQGRSILLVEDEPEVLAVMTNHLGAMGFSVLGHQTADSAAAAVEAGLKPDFVLTDLVLSGAMQGAQLAAMVHERLPDTGILIHSGYSDDQNPDLPRQDGRIAWLQKPVARAELSAAFFALDSRGKALQSAKE